MSSPAKILSVSYDAILLTTRNAVLRHAGYEVVPAMSKEEAKALLQQQPFDLVVLGHGIPDSDRNEIVQAGHSRALVMYNPGDNVKAVHGDAFVDASNGPRELLRAVAAVLGCHDKARAAAR